MTFRLLFILLIIAPLQIYAQNPQQDSVQYYMRNIEASDTIVQEMPEVYKKLEEKATGSFEKKIYQALIKPPSPAKIEDNTSTDKEYRIYKGKRIREIKIVVLDPFGTNINEIDSIQENSLIRIVNGLHLNTKQSVIRKNLLFKEGQTVNPLVIAETETFLRSLGNINDVRISLEKVPLADDSVDVWVIVRDVWSIGLNIHELTFSNVNMEIFDNNFLGSGNKANINLIYEKDYSLHWGYGAGYFYKNFLGSFVDLEGSYLDDIADRQFSLSAERPLQITFNYFGQISYFNNRGRTEVVGWDSISPNRNNTFSVSLGRAITLPANHTTRRLVFSGRYMRQNPQYKDIQLDTLRPYQFAGKQLWLFQASLYQQAFYREHLIHNFGVAEDIAHGFNISSQFGYGKLFGYKSGFYSSLSGSIGDEFKTGDFYVEGSISSYFNQNEFYQGAITSGIRYFSPLMKIGRSRFRQFININYSKILNPANVFDSYVTFSALTNLNTNIFDNEVKGRERLMLNLESDVFSPINIIGFKFLFYSFFDFAWVNPSGNLFSKNNFYGGAGIGVRVRNDLLVLKTLDLKIGYYPHFNQNGLGQFADVNFTEPKASPNFVPDYPSEILLK